MEQNISMTDVALLIGNLHLQTLALQNVVAQLQGYIDESLGKDAKEEGTLEFPPSSDE